MGVCIETRWMCVGVYIETGYVCVGGCVWVCVCEAVVQHATVRQHTTHHYACIALPSCTLDDTLSCCTLYAATQGGGGHLMANTTVSWFEYVILISDNDVIKSVHDTG